MVVVVSIPVEGEDCQRVLGGTSVPELDRHGHCCSDCVVKSLVPVEVVCC